MFPPSNVAILQIERQYLTLLLWPDRNGKLAAKACHFHFIDELSGDAPTFHFPLLERGRRIVACIGIERLTSEIWTDWHDRLP